MILRFSPQRNDAPLSYQIEGEIVQVNLAGQAEVLDFSGQSEDGFWQPDDAGQIDALGVVEEARREGGVLHLTLRSHHGREATEEELFPQPFETTAGTYTFGEVPDAEGAV